MNKGKNIDSDFQPTTMKRAVLPLNSQLRKQMIAEMCKEWL